MLLYGCNGCGERHPTDSNSESEMTEAINTIEAMSSVDEALDYFYNDLNWDKSSQEVKDFIEIITHHFSSK